MSGVVAMDKVTTTRTRLMTCHSIHWKRIFCTGKTHRATTWELAFGGNVISLVFLLTINAFKFSCRLSNCARVSYSVFRINQINHGVFRERKLILFKKIEIRKLIFLHEPQNLGMELHYPRAFGASSQVSPMQFLWHVSKQSKDLGTGPTCHWVWAFPV
jgi:hypothetical protein